MAPKTMQCVVRSSPGQALCNSISQGRGLEFLDCAVHVVKCEIRARGPRSAHGECENQADMKDDVMMGAYFTKC